MKIQILSDLHIEFEDFDIYHVDSDVLILAGDIYLGEKGITWILNQKLCIPVLYVLGNHEYYRNVYPKLLRKIIEQTAGTNISILENESIQIDNIVFHGCTLWTDFNLFGNPRIDGYECQKRMTDFKLIRKEPNYSKLRSLDVSMIHKQSMNWLIKSYEKNKGDKNVIITHHAPSIQSVPIKFKSDPVSVAFASNLEPLVQTLSPELWIHGHIHTACDYTIGNTRIVCNPKGYPDEDNTGFKPNLSITL